jgi:amidohydrolase
MDALPIHEETGLPYASRHEGKMHACGHDGHTAILATTARLLSQVEDRPNNVCFVFQPAEEGGAGAARMIDDGVLTGRAGGLVPEVIFGLHADPRKVLGAIGTRVGPFMAAASMMRIEVRGQGAHAAAPHLGVDPVVVAAHIITALQTIASRNIDPLESVVVTVASIHGGLAHNVIPEQVQLTGTLRSLKAEVAQEARARIETIVAQIAAAFGASGAVHWDKISYPVTANERIATEHVGRIAASLLGEPNVDLQEPPVMGGEDFSFYGHHIPACFYWLGLRRSPDENYPGVHHPRFDFNDDALPVGVELMASLALSELPDFDQTATGNHRAGS